MADEPKTATEDSELEAEQQAGVVDRWLKELKAAEKHEDKWRERAGKILELYTNAKADSDGSSDSSSRRFNILYANTEVLKGALYSQCPSPDCRRRHLDKDAVGRVAAMVLQRALIAALDQEKDGEDFDYVMRSAVFDMVLPGRAVSRVKYSPVFAQIAPTAPPTQVESQEAAPQEDGLSGSGHAEPQDSGAPPAVAAPPPVPAAPQPPQEELAYECTETEHIEWAMYRYSPAKRWKKVRWVAFGELLTRDDCVREFGEELGRKIELKWKSKGVEDGDENEIFKRALVWVIWNKTKREVVCVSEGYKDGLLRVVPDPLRLEGFFPCPRPLYSIFTTNDLRPVPEYKMYEDHALQLDLLEERIAALTDELRNRGVYDAAIEELANLSSAKDGTFIPVKNYKEFLEKGGLDELFKSLPIEGIAKVLAILMEQADAKKAQIYEVIGISDIMRGATKSQETLGAQKIKDQWGSVRIGPRQQEVQRYARDLIRIHAEIMAEHFSAKTLAAMSGIELFFTLEEKAMAQQAVQAVLPPPPQPGVPPQAAPPAQPQDPRLGRPTWDEVMQVLRSDKLRGFKVDIETDSTVKHRADEEQKNRVELITAVTGYLEKVIPAVVQGLIPKKFAGELLAFGVRAFPTGPQIEEMLDELTGGGIDQAPPGPPPEVMQLQQQLAELKPQADEANLKREELDVQRMEIGARREEVQRGAAESQTGGAPRPASAGKPNGESQDGNMQILLAQIMQLIGQNAQAMNAATAQNEQLEKLTALVAQLQGPRIREVVKDPVTKKVIGATDKPMDGEGTERYRELVRDPVTQKAVASIDRPVTH